MEHITIALQEGQMQALITSLDEFSKQVDNLYITPNLPQPIQENCINTLNQIAAINEKVLSMQSVFTADQLKVMLDAATTTHKILNEILDDENAPADFRNEVVDEFKKVNRLKKLLQSTALEHGIAVE